MEQAITRLSYEGKEIILIATAHVSKESVTLVKEVIEAEQPNSVCIELDEARYDNIRRPKAWEETDIVQVIKSKKVGYLLVNLVLSSYQKKMAKQLDTPVGGEMLQGISSAEEIGAKIVLADRDIQTTFLRIWRELSFWEKSKLLVSLFVSFEDEEEELSEADLANMLESDMLESALADLRKEFPVIGQILVHERDIYLATKIKEAPGNKIVAVLGGAHVPGVTKEIFETHDLERISTIPPAKKATKVIGWLFPAAIVALVIYSFFISVDTGWQQLSTWILWNSGLAALFTLISLGHPLTILTSFVTAPIGTLNPLVAVGFFAGIVEATVRKPTVHDLQTVQEDISSVKGFFRNRVLRILLIVMMANIGGVIGNFIGGADMIRNLFS